MTYKRTIEYLRVVEESDAPFADDEPPSLGSIPVYDTTSEEVTQTRGPRLAKCKAEPREFPWRTRRAK